MFRFFRDGFYINRNPITWIIVVIVSIVFLFIKGTKSITCNGYTGICSIYTQAAIDFKPKVSKTFLISDVYNFECNKKTRTRQRSYHTPRKKTWYEGCLVVKNSTNICLTKNYSEYSCTQETSAILNKIREINRYGKNEDITIYPLSKDEY